jgi:hypothetical protein
MHDQHSCPRVLVSTAITWALFSLGPEVARAQEPPGETIVREEGFASQWNVVLAAEDLLVAGYSWSAEGERYGDPQDPVLFTRKAWGTWNPVRFAADVFVLPSLSVGAAVRVEHLGQTYPLESAGGPSGGGATEFAVSSESESQTTVRISPRLGYGRWFGDAWGGWLRAGVELASNDGSATPSPNPGSGYAYGPVVALSFDALAVLQPFPHTIVAFGPTYRRSMIDEASGHHLLGLALNLGAEL